MNYYFSFLLLSSLIISIICVIPEWNLEKAGEDLLSSSNEYIYTATERLMHDVYLKMTRKITKSNNTVNYINHLYMSYNYGNIQERDVPFDFVESFYRIGSDYIVCPKGPFHPYNLNTGQNISVTGFQKKGLKDWDLRCFKHENNNIAFFLVFYLMNGNNHFFYTTYGEYNWGYMQENFADELYDFKLEDAYYYIPEKDREYSMMPLLKEGNNLTLIGKVVVLKNDKKDVFTPDEKERIVLCLIKKYTQAYYSSNNNSFYFITYDDIYNFTSGYILTSNNNKGINHFDWAENIIINNNTPFEFIEKGFEIEVMNIMLYNRFVYYKLKNINNEKIYHGIFDIVANKVIFNTKEKINYFIPFSNTSILAITPTTAYKICMYNDNGECAEECSEQYKYDIDGNTCSSSSICENNKITFIPSGICIDSCDERFYIKNNNQCGLCKDFYPEGNAYKLVNGTNCRGFNSASMEYYNEDLKLLKCKNGFKLENNDCVSEGKECYKLCEKNKCTDYSDKEDDQKCTSCIDNYYLEKGNCKQNCSERYAISGKECIPCSDNNCESFTINTCNCNKCKDNFFLNISDICDQCDLSCAKCEGHSNNCTACDDSHFLFEYKCYNCATNCNKTESDNCKCNECNKGYYVKDYLCYNCINNCDVCNNSTKCDKCANDYYINAEGSCSPCPLNCKERESDNCQCKSCDEHFFLKEQKCESCSTKCKTCENGTFEGNDNCLSCDVNSEYKYLLNDTNNRTCVENCTLIGRDFSEDKKMCILLNNTKEENFNKEADYILWIFVIIIVIILIVISACILKKCCFSSKDTLLEDISKDLDEKELFE